MNRHLTPLNGNGGARRRRPPRPIPLTTILPEAWTAAAMEDAGAADDLVADLLALVEAGLIVPVEDAWGDVRYAPAPDEGEDEEVEPTDPDAA
jgi:hypothetical protein